MVTLWRRFRDWLIRKLGGVTREAAEAIAERWDEDVHRLAVLLEKNAALTDTNEQLRDENKRLKMELDRNPPPKMLSVETLLPRTLEAAWTYGSYPEAAVDMDKVAKDHVTRQILDRVREMIHYSFEHDFFGNSRVRATLQILKGPGPIDE